MENYDLLKQLINGQISRNEYEAKVAKREADKRAMEATAASDQKLFDLAKKEKAKQEAKNQLISMLPKEDQQALKESEINNIVDNLVGGPAIEVDPQTGFPTEEPEGTQEPQQQDPGQQVNVYTIFDIYGNEDAFQGTSSEFAKFMTGNPKYYATKEEAAKALAELYASQNRGATDNSVTATTTTTPDKLYWGRYDSGSWATSTEAGKPEGFTWGWELPEFAGLGKDDFLSDKSLDEILKQVTDGASGPAGSSGQTKTPTVITGGTNFDGRMGSQIWQDSTGQKYLAFSIPGTNMFIRYKASDDDLAGFFTTGMPDIRNINEDAEDWNNSLWLGNYVEIDDDIKLGISNPLNGLIDNFAKVKKVQPWMEDDELYSLYLESIVEDRDIEDYEWQGTEWWQTHTKEQRDWLLLSQGKGIGALPADAQALLDNNRVRSAQLLKQYGVTNGEQIVNADGDTLIDFFATQLSTGAWTEISWVSQAQGLGDSLAGIERDVDLVNWLENIDEGMTVTETQAGYAQAKALAQKWLGPSFANFEDANLAEYAGIIRNAESTEVGIAAVEEKLKNIRKALFSTDMYEENLTYEDIASPWRNYSFQFLGQRMDETSSDWINVLKANDQEKINSILLEYGLNNDVETVFDKVTDGIVSGITPQAVVRGIPT